ncbi:hypothetical protein [uncultured Eudoraea sp.]|uniref:hypothetical protein n=1 Tax=uncultured Eudoraea sp. TaxID=1035614 RepID=UPI00262569CB|nr:hypothetical protein [uncultured Eudoraea sp.]
MKKISLVSGIGILALALLSFVGNGEGEKSKEGDTAETILTELQQPFINKVNKLLAQVENEILSIEDIVLIETDEKIDLGFDTAEYLPVGFDPYTGMEFDLDEINFIETDGEIDLGFDTAEYLPKGFNPYKGMEHENLIDQEAQIGFHLDPDSK